MLPLPTSRSLKVIGLLLLLLALPILLFAAQLPAGFIEEQLVTNLDPTSMSMAPDGRIFITEKNGDVLIVEDGELLPDPFVSLEVDNFNERGLGGMVFHPDFDQNSWVYFYYTVPGGNYNRVVRITANGDTALPGSETIIFELDPMPGTIHNGGSMDFGLDGKLYISVGDGADGNAANSFNSLLGKLLRINEDGSIPEDNPFYDTTTGNFRAIYALGFRNSFSTAMHPVSGRIFGCDVGGGDFEEVNEFVAGAYYGWPEVEGPRTNQVVPQNYRDPLYAYDHGQGCAIIAAAFYAPATPTFPPRYHDQFFFADYCEGYLKVIDPDSGDLLETFATDIDRPLALLTAPNGDLYYLARAGMGGGSMQDNTSTTNGSLWRIRYTGSGAPFVSVQPEDVFLPVGEDAIFNVGAVGAPTLTYQWQRDGIDIPGANASAYTLTNVQLTDDGSNFQCRISNEEGVLLSNPATLLVTANNRPLPVITSPVAGSTYRAGDILSFSGTASDPEDGDLDAANLRWFIDFHHDTHTHPALENVGGINQGAFAIPRVGEVDENVWYRIYLVAEDEEGLTRTTFVDIYPEITDFTVSSNPPGLRVIVDGSSSTAPVTTASVVGVLRNLTAPLTQADENVIYQFTGWQDNSDGNPLYTFLAGDEANFVAHYETIAFSVGDGSGLTADFFLGNEERTINSGRPVATRIDPTVDFNFGQGAPVPELDDDFYMIRWRGELLAPVSDDYTFYVTADDGVRLWIDDQLVIDQWVPQAATEASGQINLEGGRRYRIRLDYFEAGGLAEVHLEYGGIKFPRSIIPTTQLYPDPFRNIALDFNVDLFPNPAADQTSLRIQSWRSTQINWRLLDVNGRQLDQGKSDVEIGSTTIPVYLQRLSRGLYYLEVDAGARGKVLKSFVKS